MPDLDHAREVAITAANAASKVIMNYYRGEFDVEIKADQTPVTIADKMAEDVIRHTIRSEFPDHAIYGEERGFSGVADEG